MKIIQAVKVGNVINLSIDGKLHKKICGNSTEANELFKVVLKAKENPSDENIKALRMLLNEKTRIAYLAGLETDLENGEVFLAGFNTPIPLTLLHVIEEYHENGYPMEAIINFWKLLMINPDKRVRTSLFDFIATHDFVLTDKGYMVVYKAVYRKDGMTDTTFEEFISAEYLKVKKIWKCSPNKYVVYKECEDCDYHITKIETAETWDEKERNIEVLGKLGDLFNSIFNTEINESAKEVVYTDMHTRKMTIVLGKPVQMERKDCDGDPANECSFGLHCGSTSYVNTHGSNSDAILVCFVNPANVIAVPNYDHSKFRCSEYFPFALAEYVDKKINIIEEKYFEDNYANFEQKELEKLIKKVKGEELPFEAAKKAEEETRPMSELLKMLESRLYEIIEE